MGRKVRKGRDKTCELKRLGTHPSRPVCPICGTKEKGVYLLSAAYGCPVHATCYDQEPRPAQTCCVCGNASPRPMVKYKSGRVAHRDCHEKRKEAKARGKKAKKAKRKRYAPPKKISKRSC